jgi:hypothetical protein
LNQLIANESSHQLIIEQGNASTLSSNKHIKALLKIDSGPNNGIKNENEVTHNTKDEDRNLSRMNNEIELKKNPVKILMKKLLFTEST